jgi:hypothetical protein
MAIKNLAKAEALIRQLAEDLKVRTAGAPSGRVDTVREARDSDGYPYLVLSDNGVETAGNPVIFIRIKQIDAGSKDIFGNDLKAYAPHVCELAYEKASGSGIIPSHLDVALVMFETSKTGVKIKVKEVNNSNAVTDTNVDNNTLTTTALELDWLRWPTKGV